MQDKLRGTVIRSTGSWFAVKDDQGNVVDCRIKGKFRIQGIKTTNPVAVGDVVAFTLDASGNGVIEGIAERKNYIIRRATKLSSQYHVIASNIDQALLIVSLIQPKTSTSFIDRFLVTSEAYSIPAVIIFNKVDLYDHGLQAELEYLKHEYEKAGYECLATSAIKKTNIEQVKEILKAKTTLLAGQSGVGKSSLVNAVEPSLDLKTAEISRLYETGKHTTTFAEMFELSFDARIIDSPGIKSFGIVDFHKEELSHYFPEIFKKSQDCKFGNCQHINEPKCAVKKAVEEGEIASFRYENYLKLYESEELGSEY